MLPGGSISVTAAAFLAATLASSSAFAAAPTPEELTKKFVDECRPQFISRAKKGEKIQPLIQKCVKEKAEAYRKDLRNKWNLVEFTPWFAQTSGPAKAKGVIYFIRGWGQTPCCQTLDEFRLVPYFLKSLSENGWDLIGAKLPFGTRNVRPPDAAQATSFYVKHRVGELKEQGYRKVVLGGHSWGGWLSMMVAQDKSVDLAALILNSPNTYGTPVLGGGDRKGRPNPDYEKNVREFVPLIDGIDIPTALLVFRDDPYEPPARGLYAGVSFALRDVPSLVVDMPNGFTGHSAGWLPIFDYAFGACIQAFLDRLHDVPCRAQGLSKTDFRSIVVFSQLASAENAISNASPLGGKRYGVFTLDDSMRHYEYVSAGQRINMHPLGRAREPYDFRDGLHCAGQECSLLVRWSEGEILEFDYVTKRLKAWWVEIR